MTKSTTPYERGYAYGHNNPHEDKPTRQFVLKNFNYITNEADDYFEGWQKGVEESPNVECC